MFVCVPEHKYIALYFASATIFCIFVCACLLVCVRASFTDLMCVEAGVRPNGVPHHSVKAAAAARGRPEVRGQGRGEESAVAT